MVRIVSAPGSKASQSDQTEFAALVRKGGEVAQVGLLGRVAQAELLAFAREGIELVGVGALKHPSLDYRAKVSAKSAAPLPVAEYPLELGWIYVEPWARKGGLASKIVASLMERHSAGVFATSHTVNTGMHRILTRSGFAPAGTPYDSDRPELQIQLFLRAARH